MTKAISVRQPWAWAIVHAGKYVENRTWRTGYRGPLFIHAAKGMAAAEYHEFCRFCADMPDYYPIPEIPRPEALLKGGIVGSANLTECFDETYLELAESAWFTGPYGFLLTEIETLPFAPCKGALGLFEIEWSGSEGWRPVR
jgi:hypothetical protein